MARSHACEDGMHDACRGYESCMCMCHGKLVTGSITGSTVGASLDPQADEEQRMIAALTDWWMDTAKAEVEPVAVKAVEYGPNSMIEVGRAMGRMSGRDLTNEEAIEVACMFYISGKLGRWVDAVAHGKRPSDDTIHDIGIYIKMTQRNRQVGGWPFAPDYKGENE